MTGTHSQEDIAEPQNGSAFARAGERLEDLQRGGLKILQPAEGFRFGTDSVLLADFAAPRRNDRVADLGAGNGVLCLLMSDTQPTAVFDAVEADARAADLARRNVALNGLRARVRVHDLDMRAAARVLGYEGHSLVVCNPPYHPGGGERCMARHMGDLTLEDVARSGARLLKEGGRMALVFPAARMLDLMEALRGARLEPKRARLVQDRPGAAPKLFLLEAVKGGGRQIDWRPCLVLRGADGAWSDEFRRIYHLTP